MAEYIESKCRFCFNLAACAAWIRHGSSLYSDFSYSVADCPYYVSSADVVEVKHGRWEDVYGGKYQNKRYRCTVCKEKALFKFWQDELLNWHEEQKLSNYCPNCGARMDGGKDEE